MRNIRFNNLSRKNKNISIRFNKRLSDYLRTVKTSLDNENLNENKDQTILKTLIEIDFILNPK